MLIIIIIIIIIVIIIIIIINKAIEQYFHVVPFIMLSKLVLIFTFTGTVYYAVQGSYSLGLWMKLKCVTNQMKAIEQYFSAALSIWLYKVVARQ